MQLRFGDFVLDTDTRELMHQSSPVHLSPKAFQLLELLLAARPKALAKDTLYSRLWRDTFVVQANSRTWSVSCARRSVTTPAGHASCEPFTASDMRFGKCHRR